MNTIALALYMCLTSSLMQVDWTYWEPTATSAPLPRQAEPFVPQWHHSDGLLAPTCCAGVRLPELPFATAPIRRQTINWMNFSPASSADWAGPYPGIAAAAPEAYQHTPELAFFCRVEVKLEKAARMPVKFRLGDVRYVDYLEGKRRDY